ncbi:MAG: glycoside hydrolase family 3 protein [Clostridia bacterium]|nr:glycoside hydrolase family 3 protein [Clostridia bacterium]
MKKPDMSTMTLREKVAQTLLVRMSDLLLKADTAYDELRDPSEAKKILDENQFGGIWAHGNIDVNGMSKRYDGYFNFTSESMVKWIEDNTKDMKIPPICANDAFGKISYSDLSEVIDGLIVGAANSEEYAYELGKCFAEEHKATGLNWIWSPNVDILNRFAAGVVRPFTNFKDQQIALSTAFIKGMQSVGFAATAKHFPGPDAKETRDSHIVPTNNSTPLDEWEKEQGAIFQAAIDCGVCAIMVGARTYPAMDDTKIGEHYMPIGLSEKALLGKLKGEMGFEGVIITDDVNMGGFTSVYGADELYGRFLAAGNDMLLGVSVDAVDKVMNCIEKGIVTEERINDACRRVLEMKEKVGLFDDDYSRKYGNLEELKARTAELTAKIARDGITLLRDNIGLLPMKKKINHVTIFTYTHADHVYGTMEAMKQAFNERGAEVTLKKRPESYQEIEEAAEKSDLIIYAGYIAFHEPKGAPSFYGDEFWALRYAFTAGKEKSIGISLGYPYIHYYFMDDAEVFVNLYRPHEAVLKAFVAAVYGESEFKGVAPLNMNMD